MKPCVSSIACSLYLFLVVICVSTAAAAPSSGTINGNGDGAVRKVTILMNDHAPIDMELDPDGSLASVELNTAASSGMTVESAVIYGYEYTTCFFWRQPGPAPPESRVSSRRIVSATFTVKTMFVPGRIAPTFEEAERLYCYDTAADVADRNTFTLFVQSGSGHRTELLRLRDEQQQQQQQQQQQSERNDGYVELKMSEVHPELSIGTKASVIGRPASRKTVDYHRHFKRDLPECHYFTEGQTSDLFEFGARPIFRDLSLGPTERLDRIVCFRDEFEPGVKERWRRNTDFA